MIAVGTLQGTVEPSNRWWELSKSKQSLGWEADGFSPKACNSQTHLWKHNQATLLQKRTNRRNLPLRKCTTLRLRTRTVVLLEESIYFIENRCFSKSLRAFEENVIFLIWLQPLGDWTRSRFWRIDLWIQTLLPRRLAARRVVLTWWFAMVNLAEVPKILCWL